MTITMTPSKNLLLISLAFITGLAIRSFFAMNIFYIYCFSLAVGILLLFLYHRKMFRLILLFSLFIALGIIRYQIALPNESGQDIAYYNEQEVLFRGIVAREVDSRVDHVKLTIQVESMNKNDEWRPVSGLVLVKTKLYPIYYYGDQLEISCYLRQPQVIEGFAYDRYLAKSNIYSTCYQPFIKILSPHAVNRLVNQIFIFKEKLTDMVKKNLSEPHSSIVNALIFNARGNIPQKLNDQFSITGITHVIAISGQHITLMAALLTSLLISLGLRRGQVFWPIVFMICFYIFLVGLPASAVRAGIMALIFLLAMKVGRLNNSLNGLVLAAALMLLINPKLLRDDIGFQLSFLAVLSLISLVPFLQEKLEKLPSLGQVKEMVIITFSAQFFTGPLIIYYFGRLSLIAPVVNVLVLPIFPFLMILGFLAIIMGFFTPIMAQILFWPIWLLISYFIKVVEICASLPLAAVNIRDFSGWLAAIFYMGLFMVILKPWKFVSRNKERSLPARIK